jgi:hypothetical protein
LKNVIPIPIPTKGLDFDPRHPPEDMTYRIGGRLYFMGKICRMEIDEGETVKPVDVATAVWPVATYHSPEDDERGVVYKYITHDGKGRIGFMPAGAFASGTAAAKACEAAANLGVQIGFQRAKEFCESLHAFTVGTMRDCYHLTRKPGWHDGCRAYVNGEYTHGPGKWSADPNSSAISGRSTRSGSVDGWKKIIGEHVTTHGLRAVLGVSLAGPLVEVLGADSFGVHVYAKTSCGKTTASDVAASVWGHKRRMRQSWNATINAIEGAAEQANSGCLILDELGQFRGGGHQLGNLIYDLMSQQGRLRMTSGGDQKARRTWASTVLSNGEISLEALIGDELKGGQMVRLIDCPIAPGDLTRDGAHADAIKMSLWGHAGARGHYGEVSDRWVYYLTQRPVDALQATRLWVRERLAALETGKPEDGRILNSLAIVGVALIEGVLAGILPWGEGESMDALLWLAQTAVGAREGMDTPDERMLSRWLELVDTEPGRFPRDGDEKMPTGPIFGYRVSEGHREEVWTCESMVKKSGLPNAAGVSARSWLQWATDEGHARDAPNMRCAGRQRNWKVFPLK